MINRIDLADKLTELVAFKFSIYDKNEQACSAYLDSEHGMRRYKSTPYFKAKVDDFVAILMQAIDQAEDNERNDFINKGATEMHAIQSELDDADRRAGAAERKQKRAEEHLRGIARYEIWREEQTLRAGYTRSTDFETVWEETLKKAKQHTAILAAMS